MCASACSCLGGVLQSLREACGAIRRRTAMMSGGFSRNWLGSKSYWDAAYASGRYSDEYEWNQSCDVIWPYVEEALEGRREARVLHVGCGNSGLGRFLVDRGVLDVTNVDYSDVVIDMMRRKEPSLCWVHADCTQPGALGCESYDCCIDKGAIDSLFEVGSEPMRERGRAMIEEIHRALRPGGRYLIISNGGTANDALAARFAKVESKVIEGFACDLYYKLVMVVLCTKQ
eukprot:TRINITY_DN14399_c0_g2_i2.p2 TRINITY_DN14399_c0_g2~~TRINITY_DN14399_c0_g2_i2.p2  ORF type:complete len:230 (+),score=51.30 TRINITY_DN14399_c0_g2_i2:1037-1726(+)